MEQQQGKRLWPPEAPIGIQGRNSGLCFLQEHLTLDAAPVELDMNTLSAISPRGLFNILFI